MSNSPPAGWYFEPTTSGDQSWVLTSRVATRISVVVAIVAATAALVSAALIVFLLIAQRPIPGSPMLLLAAGLVLVIGQVWTVQIIVARRGPRASRLRAGLRDAWRQRITIPEYLFRGLSPATARITYAVFVAGWLAAMTAWPLLIHGAPGGTGVHGCAYVLVNHSEFECVSKAVYDQAGAALQRFYAGILLAFLALQAGVALSHVLVVRRRNS